MARRRSRRRRSYALADFGATNKGLPWKWIILGAAVLATGGGLWATKPLPPPPTEEVNGIRVA